MQLVQCGERVGGFAGLDLRAGEAQAVIGVIGKQIEGCE